jgi:hypothetical protein
MYHFVLAVSLAVMLFSPCIVAIGNAQSEEDKA